MLLAIDIGNSNISIGIFQKSTLTHSWRITSDLLKEADEYSVLLSRLVTEVPVLKNSSLARKYCQSTNFHIVMCSVVPPLTDTLSQACSKLFKLEPLIVGRHIHPNITINYDVPEDVGADRIVNALAAHSIHGGQSLIIVDLGTATVFDAISKEGSYLGGAIAPGLVLSAEALFLKASQLKRVELAFPPRAIGQNTNSSVQSGLIFGHISLIEGMVNKFKQELGKPSKVIGTGGLINHIVACTTVFDIVEPNLSMEGLRLAFEYYINPTKN